MRSGEGTAPPGGRARRGPRRAGARGTPGAALLSLPDDLIRQPPSVCERRRETGQRDPTNHKQAGGGGGFGVVGTTCAVYRGLSKVGDGHLFSEVALRRRGGRGQKLGGSGGPLEPQG